jgi:hypothetical protein
MIRIRDSVESDALLLAPKLREADLEELDAATHLSPFEVLHTGWYLGAPCRTFLSEEGEVVGMFGVTPLPDHPMIAGPQQKRGLIWCLSSPELFNMRKYFMQNCRIEISKMCEAYNKVFNYVYEKNTTHIRWIKAMGFNMSPNPTPFGRLKKPFYYFEKVMI